MIPKRTKKTNRVTLTLTPFKQAPKLSPTFSTTTFDNLLKPALESIFTQTPFKSSSHEELFRSVQDLVCNNFGAVTYVRLNSVVEARCTTLFENDTFTTESSSSSSSSSSSESDTTCVKGVMKKWRDFNVSMSSVRSIFLYLDRSYIINNTESAIASALVEQQLSLPLSLPLPPNPNNSNKNRALATIWQMGLNSFKSVLISRNITELLVKWTNSCIKLERETSTDSVKKIDRELLREVTEMLRSLGIYKEKFEEDFITSSAEFFKSEGSNCLSTVDLATYLSRCEMRLNQAADQVAAYLDPKTRKPLVQSIENNFLRPHVKSILDSGEEEGFSLLMNGGKHDDLKRLRTLLSRVNGTESLREAIHAYVLTKANKLVHGGAPKGGENTNKGDKTNEVQTSDEDKEMISNLLGLRSLLTEIMKSSFASNESFTLAIKSAFEAAVNSRQSKPAELMAKFVNSLLTSRDAEKDKLDKIMVLFRYLQGKDVFEAFFKRDLAKRLLLGKSTSLDLEKAFIMKLKTECGGNYTSKMEGMFKDMDLSNDIKSNYDDFLKKEEGGAGGATTMDVQVLTVGYWPTYPQTDSIVLPVELQQHKDKFENYYKEKYQGRRINFQHSLCNCTVTANFPKPTGKKTLMVSEFQALVLVCFNDCDELGVLRIGELTGIEDGEVRRVLQSLSMGKKEERVLSRVGEGKEVLNCDVFSMNDKFTNQQSKIKIRSIHLKETVEENDRTHKVVLNERKHQLDAILVRCMKTRKTITHQALLAEVMRQCKFNPLSGDIKKRIESLIERDYMERGEDNSYNYLA